MNTTIKVTDPESKYFGQELKGHICYYDIHHTGGADAVDLYRAEVSEGVGIYLKSPQVDVPHYEAQLLEKTLQRLGAKVGDTVMILKTGSGKTCAGFNYKEPHVITKISSSGVVEFDNGKAEYFRPEVEVIIHAIGIGATSSDAGGDKADSPAIAQMKGQGDV